VERKCVMGFGGQRPLLIACRHASSLVADATNREAERAAGVLVWIDVHCVEMQVASAGRTGRRRQPEEAVRANIGELAAGVATPATSREEGCVF